MKRTKITATIISLLLFGAVGAACTNTSDGTGTEVGTNAETSTEATTEITTEAAKETSEAGSNEKTENDNSGTNRAVINFTTDDKDKAETIMVEIPSGEEKATIINDGQPVQTDENGVYYIKLTNDNGEDVEFYLDAKTLSDGEKVIQVNSEKNLREEDSTDGE